MAQGSWYVVGPLLGLLVVALLWVAGKPLGALGGYIDLEERLHGGVAGWRVFFLVGILVGGVVFSRAGGGWHATTAYGSFDALWGGGLAVKAGVLIGAGTLMGYGARLGGGCTSGHGICGTALRQPSSYVATMTFMATAVMSAHLIAWTVGGGR